ncbi:MAG: radical SAM protein [Aigarchaeota archaeon]|nr:radical SAM protein [Candidatus Wolframiiraptor gerlachensis]
MVDLIRVWEEKVRLVSMLGDKLSEREIEEAKRDSHAHRLPRPCGLTVHTGLGCKFGCLYCYIYDMGFPSTPRPYPLKGLQLAYALALNPAVAPGHYGTFMAFGSVTEPFMDETVERALEYLDAVAGILGNPIQLSTKAWINDELAARIRSIPDHLSILVTIVTTSLHRMLEPGAPDPEERFQSIQMLSRRGVHTCLFLRPILPGLCEREVEDILVRALDSGAAGVVLGSMRVTGGIIRRLEAVGYPYMREILSRIPGDLKPEVQVTLRMSDLKGRFARLAGELGLRVYPSACAANVDAHGLGCAACKFGPCGDVNKLPDVDEHGLMEISAKYGLSLEKVMIDERGMFLAVKGPRARIAQFREFVKSVCKRRVIVR